MLTIDTQEMKQELHALIDSMQNPTMTTGEFQERVRDIVEHHKFPIDVRKYSHQLTLLVTARNLGRAKKLVDCFGDRVLSRGGELLVRLIKLGFKLGLLAAFVIFVIFAYQKCQS